MWGYDGIGPWLVLVRHVVAEYDAAAPAPGQIAPGQVHERDQTVPVAEQVDQVQPEPGEPGDRAAQAYPAAQLHYRRPAADRRHGALVVIPERRRPLTCHQRDHLLCCMPALLDRGLSYLGNRRLFANRYIARCEDPF